MRADIARHKKPPLTPDDYLGRLRRAGVPDTADYLSRLRVLIAP